MTLDHVISRASPPYLPLFSHFRSIVPIQSFTAYACLNGAVITVAKPTAGMWPINAKLCIEQVKKFAAPDADSHPVQMLHGQRRKPLIERSTAEFSSVPLPLPRTDPQTFHDVQQGLTEWLPKLQNTLWSDPIRPQEFEQFIDSTKKVAAKSELNGVELALLHKRRSDELLQKATVGITLFIYLHAFCI